MQSWSAAGLSVWLMLGCLSTLAEERLPEIDRPYRVERDLEFRRVGDTVVRADLYRPDDEATYPLVLMIHGGAWTAGDKGHLADHARELAQAGFVAVSINYRLAPQFPMPDQIADCRAALTWAVAQAPRWRADVTRLSLWGYSAGAHLAAWMATEPQAGEPAIRCVVAGGAPCDFSFIAPDSNVLAHVFGGTPRQYPERYANASPLNHASSSAPPFFFFHGTSDLLVPTDSSRQLYDRLQGLGVDTEYYAVDNRGHMLTFIDPTARRRAIEFLRKHTTEDRP